MLTKKKILPIFISFLMAFAMMPLTAEKAHAESYDLWVGDNHVTDSNLSFQLGEGTGSYVPETNTLTLENATITGTHSDANIYTDSSSGLRIKLIGTNELSGGEYGIYADYADYNAGVVTIEGPGTLKAEGSRAGIYSENELKIDSATVTATATVATYSRSIYARGGVTITNSNVTASATGDSNYGISSDGNFKVDGNSTVQADAKYAIDFDGEITIGEGLAITKPVNWDFREGSGIFDGTLGNYATSVTIEPVYDLWVGGTRVTIANAEDVFKNGKVKFEPASGDNPAKLTLNGYECPNCQGTLHKEFEGVIDYQGDDDLTIELKGNNVVATTVFGIKYGLRSSKANADVTITGDGQLSASGPGSYATNTCGIAIVGDLTINSGTVIADGRDSTSTDAGAISNGITSEGTLTINGGSVTALGGKSGNSHGIYAHVIDINGGTVEATGGTAANSYGMFGSLGTTIGEGITKVEATGSTCAIFDNSSVKNFVPGTGWSNVEGTEGKTSIPVNSSGGTLDFQKVLFPSTSEPEPTPTPTPTPSVDKTVAKTAIDAGVKGTSSGGKVKAAWGKVDGADGYEVYAAFCGSQFQKVMDVGAETTQVTITEIGGKKIGQKNAKYYVVAYQIVNGSKVQLAKSINAHIVDAKNTKYTNPKAIKAKKSYTLKKGKKAKIKAKLVLQKKGKKVVKHEVKFRYTTSNSSVATVSKKGKIKAVGKGTCTVYVYAVNGCAKAIKVKVK